MQGRYGGNEKTGSQREEEEGQGGKSDQGIKASTLFSFSGSYTDRLAGPENTDISSSQPGLQITILKWPVCCATSANVALVSAFRGCSRVRFVLFRVI